MDLVTYPASAFKAYDIRGVVPDVLNPAFAHDLGLAFGARARSLGETTVAVGRDGRLSSPELAAALMSGLVQAGVDVIDVGMVISSNYGKASGNICRAS